MIQFDEEKIAKMNTIEKLLDQKYGKPGTPERELSDAASAAWYYGEVLRDRRHQLKLTQQQVAERLGKPRSVVSLMERGKYSGCMADLFCLVNVLDMAIVPAESHIAPHRNTKAARRAQQTTTHP